MAASVLCAGTARSEEFSGKELEQKLEAVRKEEIRAQAKVRATEQVIKDRLGELMRLEVMEEALKSQLEALDGIEGVSTEFELASEAVVSPELVSDVDPALLEVRDRIVGDAMEKLSIVKSGDEAVGMSFACETKGGLRIFTPAEVISDNPVFTIQATGGEDIEIEPEIRFPRRVEMLGLCPKSPLDAFQLAEGDSPPELGDAVLVVSYSLESEEVSGTLGFIRGIGPDVWEMDADLAPEMIGSPVISLKTEKVVGIVAPQVEGVESEWAVGTRHEEARSFAVRLDRIDNWSTVDLVRFRKESDYIRKFENGDYVAWIVHCLLRNGGGSQKKSAAAAAKENMSNPLVREALRWHEGTSSRTGSAKTRMYRSVLSSLTVKRDLSGNFSDYHEARYKRAMEVRQQAIRAITGLIKQLER